MESLTESTVAVLREPLLLRVLLLILINVECHVLYNVMLSLLHGSFTTIIIIQYTSEWVIKKKKKSSHAGIPVNFSEV